MGNIVIDKLDNFQKKIISTKLKEHNIVGILYNDKDYQKDKYDFFYDYEDQIFVSEVDWLDYYTQEPITSIENFIDKVQETIKRDKRKIDKALYVNTVFDSFAMNHHSDNINTLMEDQLNNIYKTDAFKRSKDKYSSPYYDLDTEIKKLVANHMSRPNIVKKIMENLFLSKEQMLEGIKNSQRVIADIT